MHIWSETQGGELCQYLFWFYPRIYLCLRCTSWVIQNHLCQSENAFNTNQLPSCRFLLQFSLALGVEIDPGRSSKWHAWEISYFPDKIWTLLTRCMLLVTAESPFTSIVCEISLTGRCWLSTLHLTHHHSQPSSRTWCSRRKSLL